MEYEDRRRSPRRKASSSSSRSPASARASWHCCSTRSSRRGADRSSSFAGQLGGEVGRRSSAPSRGLVLCIGYYVMLEVFGGGQHARQARGGPARRDRRRRPRRPAGEPDPQPPAAVEGLASVLRPGGDLGAGHHATTSASATWPRALVVRDPARRHVARAAAPPWPRTTSRAGTSPASARTSERRARVPRPPGDLRPGRPRALAAELAGQLRPRVAGAPRPGGRELPGAPRGLGKRRGKMRESAEDGH